MGSEMCIRDRVTKALDSRVEAAKKRSEHIAQVELAEQLVADLEKRATSEEKKETELFSDEEEIMPPPKTTEASTTDDLAGMMEKVQIDKEPAQGAGRGASSPMKRPGAAPQPSPGKGRGRGVAAPKTEAEETK